MLRLMVTLLRMLMMIPAVCSMMMVMLMFVKFISVANDDEKGDDA